MRENTLVQTHPWLIRIMASKNPAMVALAATPALLFFVWLATMEPISWKGFAMFGVGLLYWSLFEYSMHRWPYHTHFKSHRLRWFFESFHLYHHRNMGDHRVLNAGPLMMYPLLFLLSIPPAVFLSDSPSLFGSFGLGLGMYYVFYEFIHYGIHFKKFDKGYMAYIQKYHMHHHYKAWNKNFGNTIALWDIVLGTYDPKFKSFEITNGMQENMIKENS